MTLDFSTPESLATLAGTLLALVFVLIPPARRWFTALEADSQAAITGLLILAVAAVGVLLSCTGIAGAIACTTQDVLDYAVRVVFAAVLGVGANRGVFLAARLAQSKRGDARGDAFEKALQSPERAKLLG